MTLFIVCITVLYLALIMSFVLGFDKVKTSCSNKSNPETTFTVVIPFKNEADNLNDLLDSIQNLIYPKDLFEVILVNDNSIDNSSEIITDFIAKSKLEIFLVQNIKNTNSPKKDAIKAAISQAKFNWIVTTDADCIVPENWLACFDSFIQKNETNFIAGPVSYYETDTFLKRFQTLDFLSLIGVTIGGFGLRKPFLANGANLAYKKKLFITLNGFEGNSNIASGDDIFLLEKAVRQYPNKVHYLKSKHATVLTQPQPDFKNLISQRIRWAAKTSAYNNTFGKIVGLIVLLMNTSLICYLFLSILGVFDFKLLGYIFIIKLSFDFILIFKTSRFCSHTIVLPTYLISSFLYPFFCVYVAILSLFRGYKWKGNYYRK